MPAVIGGTVAVTGAAGFVGSHCVLTLLDKGYIVRACVRNANDETKTGFLRATSAFASGKLTIHSCDMSIAGVFDDVFADCDAVIHTADGGYPAVTSGEEYKATNKHILASIEASSVQRLIYTSSDEAMLDSNLELLEANPIVDHRRYTNPADSNSYATSKIETERMWEAAAAASGGKFDVMHCNPGDIIGPILSAHQVTGFQEDVGELMKGNPLPQHRNGRPWMTVDVRDVAIAHVGLLTAAPPTGTPEAGQYRFLLDTNDKVFRDDLGIHLNAALAAEGIDIDSAVGVDPSSSEGRTFRKDLIWMRLQLRNDKVCKATGMVFRSFEESLRDTALSLIKVAGVQPRMKSSL